MEWCSAGLEQKPFSSPGEDLLIGFKGFYCHCTGHSEIVFQQLIIVLVY